MRTRSSFSCCPSSSCSLCLPQVQALHCPLPAPAPSVLLLTQLPSVNVQAYS